MNTTNCVGRPRRNSPGWRHLLLAAGVMVTAIDAHAYGLWEYGAGRADFQAANRYDVNGVPWKAQAGNPVIYNFGDIAFSNDFLTAVGLDLEQLNFAVINAGNFWEQWGNISFGDASGEMNTAMVKLGFEAGTGADVPYAATQSEPAGVTERSSVDILFRNLASPGVAWTAENFQWTLTHELGHVLGIDDLYLTYPEEFVDHPVAGNDLPDLREIGCQDNVMDRVNTTNHGDLFRPQRQRLLETTDHDHRQRRDRGARVAVGLALQPDRDGTPRRSLECR